MDNIQGHFSTAQTELGTKGQSESDYFHYCTKKGFLLPVLVTLGSMCSEVLVVKGEMQPPGHTVMVPIKQEAETVP